MSRFSNAPRTDHMQKILWMFSYVKRHLESKLAFDANTRDWSHIQFLRHDWSEFYPDAIEPEPANAPTPRGKAVQLNMFCDAAHANDHVTWCYTTSIVIFLQVTPILWYSKRQSTIKSSTFGSEFVALKIAAELLEGLRYRLRMMGIPLQGTTNTFCDNGSIVTSVSDPTSLLTKKHTPSPTIKYANRSQPAHNVLHMNPGVLIYLTYLQRILLCTNRRLVVNVSCIKTISFQINHPSQYYRFEATKTGQIP